ncbi:KAP P-loop domain-containing protein [Cellulophaga geojensis KL-A]|uniref:KAP P-loop domain-containing protein n=1 Tax=Cellulophaga geojensis KL-A TaxID=1328323 RepID=A0ABN0RJM0_9FLAO|nr:MULTISPECIES: P-loop NTPase fold protein [Cellulophaga]EWH10362.1 KAP P-loop domain-containing protein [Cellulophaga geojensis KL-A]MDO6853545.1 P-loop NTPase fold protein [Cellulophaga lytica]
MDIKHSQIEIEEENPFANCKLDREKYSKILTNIIQSYSNGFVLALNNKWGAGKTTFVKMWEQDLKNNEYQTLYFNAWENDFENNPLTALMGELKSLTTTKTEPGFKKTLKKASSLTKNIAPIIAKAIADRYIDTEGIKDAIVGVTKGLSDVFENEVIEYAKKKKSVSDFRLSLSEFIANTNKGKPLIFIIDELDRCRPDYAVSILEQIKHFFSVPNIVFVLSIDKEQLGNAVKGVYGSADLDADEYLRRFIDIEYSIPEPEADVFYNYLYDYFKFDDFFKSPERLKHREVQENKANFLATCKLLFSNAKVPLRQQEKIFSHCRLALRSFNTNSYVIPHIFIFLTFIKIRHNNFYENLKSKSLSIQEVQEEFLSTIKIRINEETERQLIWLEVYIVNAYNNYYQERYYRKPLMEKDSETGKNKALISSVVKKDAEYDIVRILENISWKQGTGDLALSHFTDKIDLLEALKT